MMKNLYLSILCIVAITFTACTENFITDDDSAITDYAGGVYISIPELIDGNAVNEGKVGATTRSSAVYNSTSNKMVFSWGEEENAYVFSLNSNVFESPYDEVTPLMFTRRTGQDVDALKCSFEGPNGVRALAQKDEKGDIINYVSFRPYSQNMDLKYQSKEISFEGQCNSKNVKMTKYFNNGASDADYVASEKEASAHLGAYDFLVSAPTNADTDGSVNFTFNRVGVYARFYLKCPAEEVYEELQLVSHNTELFALTGTIDLSASPVSITPTKKSNVITLSYDYDASNETKHPGLDMTDTTVDYYYKNIGYIVSYMMLPPVDLSTAVPSGSTNTINLYLVSHTKGDSTDKHYYKATNLKKPKLTSNMLYKWTAITSTDDTPITFSEVTVQQWQDDTAIDNGESGSGTIGW